MNNGCPNLADILREYETAFGASITYLPFNINEYSIFLNATRIQEILGIDIPKHTILCLPAINNSSPVTYQNAQLIVLFTTDEQQALYQYLHELGHIFIRDFPAQYRWFSELLACSCNYFYYPNSDYRQKNILPYVLPVEENMKRYLSQKDKLTADPYLVYKSSQNGGIPFDSLIYSYAQTNTNFDFTTFLRKFIQRDRTDNSQIEMLMNEFLSLLPTI